MLHCIPGNHWQGKININCLSAMRLIAGSLERSCSMFYILLQMYERCYLKSSLFYSNHLELQKWIYIQLPASSRISWFTDLGMLPLQLNILKALYAHRGCNGVEMLRSRSGLSLVCDWFYSCFQDWLLYKGTCAESSPLLLFIFIILN